MAGKNVSEPKKATEPVYTVEEFAKAPQSLGLTNADLIHAAFKTAGIKEATVEEATKIVNKFKTKGVI